MDGVLIPELVVTRGSTYTFIVEGGTDENDLSQYHPFYITDSISGGRVQNSQDLRDVRHYSVTKSPPHSLSHAV